VPVRTINAGPSPKYFGYKRGITWLNAVNDQVAGIGQMVVPGTPRDSLFILDTLLNGQIAKTLHLLALVDPIDGTYQRRMNRQLTVQESRHRLARKICHGNRGQIRQAYREGQEDQLAALGLVLNAVVLWNTRYLDAIVENLRGSGQPVHDEDVARLSPLGHAHVNCRYAFTVQPPAELRPLRDPNARDSEDDDEF